MTDFSEFSAEVLWKLPFEPTDDQAAAIAAIEEWWNESDEQVFRLFGYAGTGKTSIAIYLPYILGLLEANRYRFGAYSGKAVNVLQTKMIKAQAAWQGDIAGAAQAEAAGQIDNMDAFATAQPGSPENCGTLHGLLYGPPIDLKKENAAIEEKIDALTAAISKWKPTMGTPTFWQAVVAEFTARGRRNMDVGFGGSGFTPDDARTLVREFNEQIVQNTRIAKARGWLYFAPQEQSPLLDVDLLIADEVSMVSDEMAHDILNTDVRVLVLGDPEQLPPVKGNGYFVKAAPDAMLSTVTRQAAGSPVLSIATQVRAGVDTATWTVPWASIDHAAFADNDAVILCWRRATRWGAVHYVREKLLGRPAGSPVAGDKIMVLANNKDLKVFNGQTFVVDEVLEPAKRPAVVVPVVDPADPFAGLFGPQPAQPHPFDQFFGPVKTAPAERVVDTFEEEDPDVIHLMVHEEGVPGSETSLDVWRFGFLGDQEEKDAGAQRLGGRGTVALATFAQAVTVHKAQGSEWGRVLFIDEGRAMFGMESNRGGYDYAERQVRRFRYTAITRARDEITIVRKS